MLPLAMSPDEFEGIAMIIVPLGIFVVLPVVIALLRHQRHMAEIYNRQRPDDTVHLLVERLDRMQNEIVAMRERQNDMILSLDSNKSPDQSLERRIQQ